MPRVFIDEPLKILAPIFRMEKVLYRVIPIGCRYLECDPKDIGAALELSGIAFSDGKASLDSMYNAPLFFNFRANGEITPKQKSDALRFFRDFGIGNCDIIRHMF